MFELNRPFIALDPHYQEIATALEKAELTESYALDLYDTFHEQLTHYQLLIAIVENLPENCLDNGVLPIALYLTDFELPDFKPTLWKGRILPNEAELLLDTFSGHILFADREIALVEVGCGLSYQSSLTILVKPNMDWHSGSQYFISVLSGML